MFSIFFTFLFVYALLYGVLSWRKPFGDNKGIYAIISVMSSFLLVLSNPARLFINFITPWFLAFGIFIFLIILVVSIFAEVKWIDVVQHSTTMTWLSIMFAIILIAGLAYVFGQQALSAGYGGGKVDPIPVLTENGSYAQGSYAYSSTGEPLPGRIGPTTNDYGSNLVNTLFHPKVLGLLCVFILGAISVYFLSRPTGGL